MTRSSDFKRAVRARMAKTGERYSAARAMLLTAQGAPEPNTQVFGDLAYPFRPGVCRDTGAMRNALDASGVRRPGTDEPLSETFLTGLAGGIGFLYIVFEYADTPPLLSVLTRYDSAADHFALGAIERLGLDCERSETGSARKAQAALDSALDAGRVPLCVVGAIVLSQSPGPQAMAGHVPTLVAVAGRQNGNYVLDVGGGAPAIVSASDLAAARAAYKKSKHRMWSVAPQATIDNIEGRVAQAVQACAERYTVAPYKGFASSFGLSGIEKWSRMLVDERHKKGWPTLFPDQARACLGLRRAFQGIEHEMTPPRAGRTMYADFLLEAEALTGNAAYGAAAQAFLAAAGCWAQVADRIASSGIGAVNTGCDLLDSYAEYLDDQAGLEQGRMISSQLSASSEPCDLDSPQAKELYASLAGDVESVLAAERAAHALLCAAV